MIRKLKILTLNIGNPSLQRASRQVEWLRARNEDVFILTETKLSSGCLFIESQYEYGNTSSFNIYSNSEFHVYFPKSSTGDLGTMILSRYPFTVIGSCFDKDSRFYSRLFDVRIDFYGTEIGIVGLYVPSRNNSIEKIIRKKQFIDNTLQYLENKFARETCPYIVCGDFNVLERNHKPHYNIFRDWEYGFYEHLHQCGLIDIFRLLYPDINEYSWVGRTNDGYRYDQTFVSKVIQDKVTRCFYIHETREIPITDHSAMVVEITL